MRIVAIPTRAILFVCSLFAASAVFANIPGGGDGTGANVMLVNNGDGTVTMDNGVVTAQIKISTAQILQLTYLGVQVTSGGTAGNRAFYWQGGSGGNDTLTTIVDPATNDGNWAMIRLNDYLTNNTPQADAYRYFAMFRGSPGIYGCEDMERSTNAPAGGALGGNGVISGAVTINSGGTLAPGFAGGSIGTRTFSNSLTLAAGSANIFEISHSPLTNDMARVFGAIINGGTLIASNISSASLTNGDSFKLFSAGSYRGAFAKLILSSLPAGFGWNTNALNTNGRLSVVVIAKPVITSASLSAGGLAFTGMGGVANANFYLLSSTNLAMPVSNWTRLRTNQFDASGNFNFTNAIGTNRQDFYLLQSQ
jgi:hypothetical protein